MNLTMMLQTLSILIFSLCASGVVLDGREHRVEERLRPRGGTDEIQPLRGLSNSSVTRPAMDSSPAMQQVQFELRDPHFTMWRRIHSGLPSLFLRGYNPDQILEARVPYTTFEGDPNRILIRSMASIIACDGRECYEARPGQGQNPADFPWAQYSYRGNEIPEGQKTFDWSEMLRPKKNLLEARSLAKAYQTSWRLDDDKVIVKKLKNRPFLGAQLVYQFTAQNGQYAINVGMKNRGYVPDVWHTEIRRPSN